MDEFVDALNRGDKVHIVYGENEDSFEGHVDSVTFNHLVIHEYVSDIYRTFIRKYIIEISKI